MRHTDLFYALALQSVEGIGDIVAKKLIAHCGTAEEVFKAKPSSLAKIEGIGSYVTRNISKKNSFLKAENEIRFIDSGGIATAMFHEPHYPEKLKHCADAPLVLFYSGNPIFESRKVISIVGTRQITPYGIEFCRNLISELAPLNPVIISGFAYGVDITAHQAAIENGLQTYGVLAHGLQYLYPARHKKYVSRLKEKGALVTEFLSDTTPEKENFVRRNRIVAGISEATIVIESAEKGGSLITANMAHDYNRDVFAVPGRVTDKYSQGCNLLIKTHKAHVLTSAADLIYMLNWNLETDLKPVQKQLFIDLDKEEQKVYDFLTSNGRELLDVIALECEFPVFRMSSLLLNLELKGVVRPLPGKQFEAV